MNIKIPDYIDIEKVAENVISSMSGESGEVKTCKHCGSSYNRDDWDFHSLCHECFSKFDSQKMYGRFSRIGWIDGPIGEYYEDSNEWSKKQASKS